MKVVNEGDKNKDNKKIAKTKNIALRRSHSVLEG
jgi:hypothetical protein